MSIFLILINLSFVSAPHTVTTSTGTTSYTVTKNIVQVYNITINNTDAGNAANITLVNITLPSGFTFKNGTNGTDSLTAANTIFTNTSSNLIWSNSSVDAYVINGTLNNSRFWFNATAATVGLYNITIKTLNTTGSVTTGPFNITVRVMDTDKPVITLISPADGATSVNTSMTFAFNVTDISSYNITNCTLILNGAKINFNSSVRMGGISYFSNVSYTPPANTWSVNCTDYDGNDGNSSTYGFSLATSHTVTTSTGTTSYTVTKNIIQTYNITINNTDVGNAGNITLVNITLPSSFAFKNGTNGTDSLTAANIIFTNTTSNLIWSNSTVNTYAINGTLNNSRFWFNATAATVGLYNITIKTISTTGSVITGPFNITVRVMDTSAPVITLISPVNGATSINTSVTFAFNVTDISSYNITNCTLILNGARINFNSSVRMGGVSYFTNLSYTPVSNTWSVNCSDYDGNVGNSSTYSFSLVSFNFNGTIRDENRNLLNNSVINITLRNQVGWSLVGYVTTTSNASGSFNFSVTSNSSWVYQTSIIRKNSSSVVDFISKAIPPFPLAMMPMLSGTTYYLTPAGTIYINVTNVTGDLILFQYQIKDTKLGYPVAEDHTNWLTSVTVYVPKNRNYSIMVYPNQSMPISYNWNNFSSPVSYGFNTGITINFSRYNASELTLYKQFNTSLTMVRISGYFVNTTAINWTNLTIIPYLLEPGNMIHSQYGAMPYNMSHMIPLQTDSYNLSHDLTSKGYFNISLPATTEGNSILLFASAVSNNNQYYGCFKNLTLTYGDSALNGFNFTNMSGLMGGATNITMDRMDGNGQNLAIPTAKQVFRLVNTSRDALTSSSAHVETTVDYSSYGAMQFTWMTDIAQSQAEANFSIPLLNVTGIKEMNIYVSGGPSGGNGQYSPKRVSTMTVAEINANNNITISTFNPQAIDASVTGGSISIVLYNSNSTCDVPNPGDGCIITSANMSGFNPMQAVMGGGKLSFRMGTSSGILIHYVNVDLLASGPPDALFDNDAGTSDSSSSFSNAIRFGSAGPTIYDYVLISLPYTEGSTSVTGLNENLDVNISIPNFYDDSWNVIWNSTNGTAGGALAGNYSHYSTYASDWQVLMGKNNCSVTVVLNQTTPCYLDQTNNRIWVRLPHFSGTGPSVTGGLITAATTTTTSSSGSGITPKFVWKSPIVITDTQFSSGYTKELASTYRIQFKVNSEFHYIGVVKLTSTTATINVSSISQQAVFNIGDEKKFDVNADNYYDLNVKLNSIKNSKANITVKSINEKIAVTAEPEKTVGETIKETVDEIGEQIKASGGTWTWWVIVIVIVAVIVVVCYMFFKKRKERQKYLVYKRR